jgi:transcription initiation factor TFIID subunit 10
MTLAGLPPPPQTPLPLARLLALATQKFIADVAADAFQYSRIRNSSATSSALAGIPVQAGMPGAPGEKAEKGGDKGTNANLGVHRAGFGGGHIGGQNKTVLTLEDLGMAVGEYGIGLRRGEFYR